MNHGLNAGTWAGLLQRPAMACVAAVLFAAGTAAHAQSAVPCESLSKLTISNVRMEGAQAFAAGEYKIPIPELMGAPAAPAAEPLPAFCRVSMTLTPSSDSEIATEVWLPISGWNGKFVGVANFGTGGALQYQNMVDPLKQGYALAANDTGHKGNGASFAIGHPEKLIDYGYRANHEMTVVAKQIVEKFYGKKASRSIWVGCSLGGVQALMEARRYPEDYDAIVAGAPPNPLPLYNAQQLWGAYLTAKFPEGSIPREKFAVVHDAVLKACTSPVGAAQGFIEDPEHCSFDPATIQCKNGDAPDCLTAAQMVRMKQLYQGPLDPRTGKVIFMGPAYGAESNFAMSSVKPMTPPLDLYRYMVYQDPNWDFSQMDYAASVDKAVKDLGPLLATQPEDLKAFLNRGGKLMLYVGWTEGHNGNDLIHFYKEILKNAPGKEENVRLFLSPGMNHCGGGMGCDTFDRIGVVDQWLATGKAPNEMLSSKLSNDKTIRTRPLCAYPAIAKYKGAGSMEEASSFSCVKP